MKYVYIALMGLIGASLRIGIDLVMPSGDFPLSTLVVNICSSFLLVLVYGAVKQRSRLSSNAIAGMGTGLMGSFSTVSSFANATDVMLLNGMYLMAAANFFLNMILTFGAALIALKLSNAIIERSRKAEHDS